jgi:SAM-dependent methyltransferase
VVRQFADHFSDHAAIYARGRPRYPAALYQRLAELAARHERSWDCATGNGQAALGLAQHFDEVLATDASAEQLAHTESHPRVQYRRALAEDSGIEPASIDLITVAAAAHWFDLHRFYAEVERVARPSALVAVWTYGAGVEPEVADGEQLVTILHRIADELLSDSWPPEFHHVRTRYAELPFPFEELEMPAMAAKTDWDLSGLLTFVHSWSAWGRHLRDRGAALLTQADADLAEAWRAGGPADEPRRFRLPLSFRVGRL